MLTGMTVDQAKAVLAQDGLKLGRVTTVPMKALPRQLIAYQQPPTGSKVESGTTVSWRALSTLRAVRSISGRESEQAEQRGWEIAERSIG